MAVAVIFSLIVRIVIGWILHGYLPPKFVNTVNNTIANLSKKLTSKIAGRAWKLWDASS